MNAAATLLVVVALLALVGVGWLVGVYNGLIRKRNLVQEAWRQIDVELRRRHDLIPNVVETVTGYAAHERETFEAVTKARAEAMASGSSPARQAAPEEVLSEVLGRFFAVAEAYPPLQADDNFMALQRELSDTEDRIAAGRRFYNANVRALNTSTEFFPGNIVAGLFGIERGEYFEATDPEVRAVPDVTFGTDRPPVPSD